jgi:hypothetical protein
VADFASLSGIRIVSGSIAIPLFGLWAADVALATNDAVPDAVSLTVGNLTMIGHVYRTASYGGERRCRVVAGAGGWRRDLTARHYQLAGGIQLSLVLRDAALEVGESVNVPSDGVIGSDYVREAAPASRVLRQLAGPAWYVDPLGVTQIQPWPVVVVGSDFTVTRQDSDRGVVEIATEDPASWLPGASFSGPTLDGTYTNKGCRVAFDGGGKLRFEVLT